MADEFRRRWVARDLPWLALIGVGSEIAGTFLPWMRSGTAQRNSYAAGGALRRLLGTTGPLDVLLAAWPLLAVLCAAAVALYLLGGRLMAGGIAAVAAAGGAAAAIAALAIGGTRYAHVVLFGPTVTLIGATVLALALVLRLHRPLRSGSHV